MARDVPWKQYGVAEVCPWRRTNLMGQNQKESVAEGGVKECVTLKPSAVQTEMKES